jgi:hypothetical protein
MNVSGLIFAAFALGLNDPTAFAQDKRVESSDSTQRDWTAGDRIRADHILELKLKALLGDWDAGSTIGVLRFERVGHRKVRFTECDRDAWVDSKGRKCSPRETPAMYSFTLVWGGNTSLFCNDPTKSKPFCVHAYSVHDPGGPGQVLTSCYGPLERPGIMNCPNVTWRKGF